MINLILIFFSGLTGIITGRITDEEENPLPGANIVIVGTDIGTSAYENGYFMLEQVPVGVQTVEVSMVGYETRRIPYVVVSSTRPARIEVKLKIAAVPIEGVKVRASYFPPKKEIAISASELTIQEIKRTTGAAGDISRMIQTLQGVNAPSDDRNDLVVRGGSPNENIYLVDGITIPNPNHFAALGSGGGPIGIIQTQFIRSARFFAGGFGAEYGDALSSVIDIKYRHGEKDRRIYMFDMSMAGAGVIFDGSINKLSYLFSARRSYLEIITKIGALDLPATALPQYYDIQLKLRYPIAANNYVSFLFIGGDSWIDITGWEKFGNVNIWNKSHQYSVGGSYNHLFGKSLLSLILSHTRNNFYVIVEDSLGDFYNNKSYEMRSSLKSVLEFYPEIAKLTTGIELRFSDFRHHIWLREEYERDEQDNAISYAYFLQSSKKIGRLIVNPGLRVSYFDFTQKLSISPRMALSYELFGNLSINAALGKYHQHPLFIWLTSNDENKSLKDMEATHYILGMDYLLRDDTKISVEGYVKNYANYPVDKEDSARILLNEGASYEGFINFNPLTSEGKGKTKGVDLILQKKFSHGFYATLVYSYAKAGFLPLDGKEKPSVFIHPNMFKFVTGIKLPLGFEFGINWRWGEGRYYYPIDSLASAREGYPIRDYNTIKQYPDYHRLDLRIEKREFHKRFTITWYMEINNVYNRKNIREYYWDDWEKKIKTSYQWGFMPVGGIEIEF